MRLYRATVYNSNEGLNPPKLNIDYAWYDVIRETPCFWIVKRNGKELKIGKESKGKYANTSKELALKDLYFRNKISTSMARYRLILSLHINHYLKDKVIL